MKFEKPEFEIVNFSNDDIIRTSVLFGGVDKNELPAVYMDD